MIASHSSSRPPLNDRGAGAHQRIPAVAESDRRWSQGAWCDEPIPERVTMSHRRRDQPGRHGTGPRRGVRPGPGIIQCFPVTDPHSQSYPGDPSIQAVTTFLRRRQWPRKQPRSLVAMSAPLEAHAGVLHRGRSSVHRIIERHDGRVSIASAVGCRTMVEVGLKSLSVQDGGTSTPCCERTLNSALRVDYANGRYRT